MQVPWQGPKWEIVAACYSLKGGRADFLMEKAAELGAFAVRPILTVRSPYLGKLLLMAFSMLRRPAESATHTFMCTASMKSRSQNRSYRMAIEEFRHETAAGIICNHTAERS